MTKTSSQRYEIDPDDGLRLEVVGRWAKEKHRHLKSYLASARGARATWIEKYDRPGATYIELFCGPGRARVRHTQDVIDGSAVAVWREVACHGYPFTSVHVCDADDENLDACFKRLRKLGAPVTPYSGPAIETVDRVLTNLNPKALHCAFLDPFNLEALDFSIIKKLGQFKRMDLILHVSTGDATRNPDRYEASEDGAFDCFAPGWRRAVDRNCNKATLRDRVLKYWLELVKGEGFIMSEKFDKMVNSHRSTMYWVVLLHKHKGGLPDKLWSGTSDDKQETLFAN